MFGEITFSYKFTTITLSRITCAFRFETNVFKKGQNLTSGPREVRLLCL